VSQQSAVTIVRPGALTMGGSLRNTGTAPITLKSVVLAARLPGTTHAAWAPGLDFVATGAVTIPAGGTYHIEGTRSFDIADPPGLWYSFFTFQTADSAWHDGTDSFFQVN
jgi:hypothetical protein